MTVIDQDVQWRRVEMGLETLNKPVQSAPTMRSIHLHLDRGCFGPAHESIAEVPSRDDLLAQT
eukprot:1444013-Prorocentrum_lima.AAC.1